MTVVALLNAFNDPHLIADTLISAEGPAPAGKETIWLPARGEVVSQWNAEGGIWHISRLARKSFSLPNHSGVLAFSGDCASAYRFWTKLSETWHLANGYNPTVRIDKPMLERVLHQAPEDAARISLLGVLIDQSGRRESFVHNKHQSYETEHFGTCYATGSGAELVGGILHRLNRNLARKGGWPSGYPISATEDLAEHISSEMLHRDSDAGNGVKQGTPLASYCGGYYDWYKVEAAGIRPTQPRVDLCVTINGKDLVITRAYFIEQVEEPDHSMSPSQRIFTSVTNIGTSPAIVPLSSDRNRGYTVTFEETWETLIPSFFLGASVLDGPSTGRISGRKPPELLSSQFPKTFEVRRVRVVVDALLGASTVLKRFLAGSNETGDAALSVIEGKLSLWLSKRLLDETEKTAVRMGSGL